MVVPNNELNMNVLGDSGKETQEVSTLETDEQIMEAEPIQEDREELAWMENQIIDTVKVASLLDKSMIGTSDVCDPKLMCPLMDIESTLIDEGIDGPMTTSIAPPPPQQDWLEPGGFS